MNTNIYNTAAEAASALAEDASVKNRVQKEIENGALVTTLVKMRVSRGMTQEQVAKAMECDPSKVSRIESGDDANLKWQDILGYAGALKVGMHVLFDDPSLPAAVRIKQYVFRIHADLEGLADLAKLVGGEDNIAKKIHEFFGEVLINFCLKYEDSYKLLPAQLRVLALPHTNSPKKRVAAETANEPAEAQPANM